MKLPGLLYRISTRERTLLLALLVVGCLIWLSNLWRRWDETGRKLRKARRELEQQAVWLRDADRLDRELADVFAGIDAEATLDAPSLVALVDGVARENGLKQELGTPVTVKGEVFLQHTLRVGLKNTPLADLITFERRLSAHYPYAALEDLSISANKADPRLLNARMTLISYELLKGSQGVDAPAGGGSKPTQ